MFSTEQNGIPNLTGVEKQAWELLQKGSQEPTDPFYTGVLGTQMVGGVSLRTVVLREVRSAQKVLICYSDQRAGKVEEIQRHGQVSWLFWDNQRKIQLRLGGTAALHQDDELAAYHWQRTTLSNRRSYLTTLAPGSALSAPSSGLPDTLNTQEPDAATSETGRSHFAVILTVVERLDWLYLGRNGHLRAQFYYQEGHCVEATWVVP